MPNLEVTLDIEKTPWPDVAEMSMWDIVRIGRLPRGTQEGSSTVSVLMRHRETGTLCLGETTLRLFVSVSAALEGVDDPFAVGRSERELLSAFRQETQALTETLKSVKGIIADSADVRTSIVGSCERLNALLEEAAGI